MLNLNAMFGSCESIFESRPTQRSVSSTELQMMEMEIATDLAQAEVDSSRAAATTMQLDQLLNMYNHVKRFGVDRSFLSLYNSNNQLDRMLGVHFPSCESVDSEGYPNSNMSRAFIVAMEDEGEGIFAKIIKGIKWIWQKIKEICSTIWNKLKSWLGLSSKKNIEIFKEAATTSNVDQVPPSTINQKSSKLRKVVHFVNKHKLAVITTALTAIGATFLHKRYGIRNLIKFYLIKPGKDASLNTAVANSTNNVDKYNYYKDYKDAYEAATALAAANKAEAEGKTVTKVLPNGDVTNLKEGFTMALKAYDEAHDKMAAALANGGIDGLLEEMSLANIQLMAREGINEQQDLNKANEALQEATKEAEHTGTDVIAELNAHQAAEYANRSVGELSNKALSLLQKGMKLSNEAQKALNTFAADIATVTRVESSLDTSVLNNYKDSKGQVVVQTRTVDGKEYTPAEYDKLRREGKIKLRPEFDALMDD